MYGEGISKNGEILDLAAKIGIVEKSGAWYSYEGDRIGQGRENAKIFLNENEDIANKIEEKIRSKRNDSEFDGDNLDQRKEEEKTKVD